MHINVTNQDGCKISIDGPEDRVLFVLEKLQYMSLLELNEKDLEGVEIHAGE